MNENLEKCYNELYNEVVAFNQKNEKKKLTICPAIKGKDYSCGGIMFVGRAINRWCPLEQSVENDKIIERLENCSKCGLEWVKGENNWKYCKQNGCAFATDDKIDGQKYNKPFWQMVQYICEQNGMKSAECLDKIVWTNLYKASYVDGKNPKGFYKEQIGYCNEILINEIEEYKPQKIYFITEIENKVSHSQREWFCENSILNFSKVYKKLSKAINDGSIEVYILSRPEFHSKEAVFSNKKALFEE